MTMTCLHELDWCLPTGGVRRVVAGSRGRWLQARQGRLWLTRSGGGDAREADVWLGAGERHWLPAGSDWLIEGWGDAAFVLLEPPPARAARTASPAAPRAASAPRFPWLRPVASSN
jgi:hypothetical protein